MKGQTPAVATVVRAGVAHRLHLVDHDPSVTAFGREVADGLGVEPGRVLKTLIVSTSGGRLVVAVVPVTGELSLKALASVAGTKSAEMADPGVAERTSGYVVGGISPIGQKRRLPTFVDTSAQGWETVYVSGGRRGLEIELSPADLIRLTEASVASIARVH